MSDRYKNPYGELSRLGRAPTPGRLAGALAWARGLLRRLLDPDPARCRLASAVRAARGPRARAGGCASSIGTLRPGNA